MKTVTENVNGKHDVQSSKINQHSNTHTTVDSRSVNQSSETQSTKAMESKHALAHGDESSVKGNVLRNQNKTSSNIIHGGDASTQVSTKQSASTKIIGGKLVHVAAREDNNITSRTSVSHSRSANNIIHSESSSSSVMKSASSENNSSSRAETKHSSQTTSQTVASDNNTADKQFNRKSAFSSTENSNNSILCRQQQSNVHPSGSSMSVSGSIQRKSISNLNDSANYSTTNRQSYSSLHRREKESVDSRMNNYLKTLESGTMTSHTKLQPCAPPTMSTSTNVSSTATSSSTIGQHSSTQQTKMLRDYHSAINVTKSSTKANASSISFGDDNKFHGTSSYKMQYVQKNDGPCPAHALNDNLKVSKVTKQHTYYVRDRR